MRYEIFKAGKRTDNNGQQVHITADDVAAIAAHYDKAKHEAPIVVGHPTTNAPAFGWVDKLTAEHGVLYASFSEVDDDFADLVRKGRYKKVSASFYPPNHANNPDPDVYYLRHVGFLGAHPPAVKGLSPINFADSDDGVVMFSEAAHGYAATLFRNLREFIIAKFGLEEADRTVPDWQIDNIMATAERDIAFSESASIISSNQPNPNSEKETDMATEEQLAAEKAAREQAEQEAAAAKAELKRLKDEQERDLRTAAHQGNVDFAENLVKAGSLKPADKELVVQVLDFADYPAETTVDFGEGKTLSQAIKDFLKGLSPILPTGETATAGRAGVSAGLNTGLSADFAEAANPEALSHHERAQALAAKENITYEEAARRTAQ